MFNVVMGFIWQTSLVALPIILVIQDTKYVVVDLIVVVYGKFDYEELA